MKKILLLFFTLLGAFGCSRMNVSSFAGGAPLFLPERYFLGAGKAQGMFFDRFRRLRKSFVLTLNGRLEGEILVLQEDLQYDDGRNLKREYRIKKIREHFYEVTSEAFDGVGSIEAYGNALNWRYILKEEIAGEIWHLRFDDWMFLQDDGVVLNRAYASKFGFDVGEVFLTFRKLGGESSMDPSDNSIGGDSSNNAP